MLGIMKPLAIAITVGVLLAIGGTAAQSSWLFPPRHEFSTGSFNELHIGDTKSNTLAGWPDKTVVVTSRSVKYGWVDVSKIMPDQQAALLNDNEWWLTEGWTNTPRSGCGPRSCPAVTLFFSEEKLSLVRVVCHICP